MNTPGFTAEFALQNNGHYQTTGTSLSHGASIRAQIICRLNPVCLERQWECEQAQKCDALPSRLQAACLHKCQALCPPICH
jgi:hypothetical protein